MMSKPPHGETHGLSEPFLLHPEQLLQGSALARDLAQVAGVLGVVQMQHLHPVEAEAPEAFLERAAGAGAVEAARLGVAVELRGEDEALGQAARSRSTAPMRSSLRPSP
jgi:hypothetical protein